ncbi:MULTISPECIES: CPBP family intramembrane glutamic endopeptidase [Bacillaceae]|uniref:CPBP family intramembrane glutamic endopeptidase n=1 Tax=Bacillaceae TaxID=186817 RepID=UPI002032DA1A|nr:MULTISPECIES: CPBP family intramembrane glutamic endopeptidase [Bacillaceae]MDX8363295.1 CPBP family intramembrane glutamic endopeptidase [Cytobacillus sp. IB215316]
MIKKIFPPFERHYWYVIIAYIIVQFSATLGVPLLEILGVGEEAQSNDIAIVIRVGYWAVISFILGLMIILFIMKKDMINRVIPEDYPSTGKAIFWSIAGIFLALFAQSLAANIEMLLGINPGSENTEVLIGIFELVPLFIIVTSIIAPILEEIIFRKIIFGSLYKKYNFWISALISSVIFALVHGEPEHILIYSSMGFTFAFLYVKTKRILVPIIAHVSMNTFVVLIQTIYKDDIEQMRQQLEQMQSIIGGL